MTTSEIKVAIIQLLAELFMGKGFDIDVLEYVDLIDDMGMDSITFISIVVEIEANLNITIPDDMLLMENFRRLDNIVKVVENEVAKGAK